MDSFHAKIGWKRKRKSENKNYHSVPFLPNAKQNFPKEQQKIQNRFIRGREKQKIKVIDPFRSYPALNRKLKKKQQKNSKKLKNTLWIHIQRKQVGKG